MSLNKNCSCGAQLTTKNTTKVGRMCGLNKVMLLVNCKKCNSTICILGFNK